MDRKKHVVEIQKSNRYKALKHGFSVVGSKYNWIYRCVWKGMIQRCHCPTDRRYKRYGARGIFVCERWHNPVHFVEDMYEDYIEHCSKHGTYDTTLDRIDNSKGYSPDNCRFLTRKLQNWNRGGLEHLKENEKYRLYLAFDSKEPSLGITGVVAEERARAKYLGIKALNIKTRGTIRVRLWGKDHAINVTEEKTLTREEYEAAGFPTRQSIIVGGNTLSYKAKRDDR